MIKRHDTISVRHLVEFILRSGDLDTSHGTLAEMDAMVLGGKIHRKLQKEAGPSYRAEVSLKHTTEVDENLTITVTGRADGIITESVMAEDDEGMLTMQDVVTVDEIKGTYHLGHIDEPVPVHMAQAKCYAYFYALNENLKKISVRLTYAHLKSGKIKRFTEDFQVEELREWYEVLMEKYAMWIRWHMDWKEQRNASIEACSFPFTYRESQKKLVSGVYQTILRGKKLFIQAPTGTGKTISAIYPSVKAIGAGEADRLFYLTAKTIARTVAEDTFALLQEKGLDFKVLTLTARDKICIFDQAACIPEICPRARGHFDRVNEAVFDMITHEVKMTRQVVEAYAEKYQVCPFEMSLDAALWIDGVICDYNYVFDPDVALKRFENESKKDSLYLIDEVHNLVDRARSMYSAALKLEDLREMRKDLTGVNRSLSGKIEKVIQTMKYYRDESEEPCELTGNIGGLVVHLMKLQEALEEVLKGDITGARRETATNLYFAVRKFVACFDRMDDRYLIYFLRENDAFSVKMTCVDPSKDLDQRIICAKSAIYFSATLLPVRYYKEMLSSSYEEDYDLYVDSPFDPSRRLLLSADDVSSRYSRRDRKEYEKIASYIRTIIRAKHGNYIVFFPSYKLMQDVFEVFTDSELMKAGHGLNVVVQESEMDEQARQDFLDQFQAESSLSTIGFCVMGGIFSEGIDLKEDRLIGAIVVGTGLPMVSRERELLRRYFDESKGKGFDYAYLYPGMNKVLQAAGRVIRTEEDEGVIALLDERFGYSAYKNLFPREWVDIRRTNLQKVEDQINDFWDKR